MNFIDRFRIKRAFNTFGNPDRMLGRMGLQRSNLGADLAADFGFFAFGCICGGLVGMFFAPRRGVELRGNFRKAIGEKGVWTGVSDTVKSELRSNV